MNTELFWEFGLVWWAFILFIWFAIYLMKRMVDYIPRAVDKHFVAIDKMQEKFSDNLDNITAKNGEIANGFITQLWQITKEHEAQNYKLEKMHDDIKVLHTK